MKDERYYKGNKCHYESFCDQHRFIALKKSWKDEFGIKDKTPQKQTI